MGLLAGSASFTRFTVEGELPGNAWDFIAEQVTKHSFKDIDDTLDELSIGWVSVGDMFDSRFAYGSYAAGDYVTLAMRVDERKVSGAVLKKFAAKEEARIKEEKDLRRLSRTVRLEIKERIKAELMRKSPPVPAAYDLCWNVPKGTVLFFSNGRKPLALLEELFKETFGLSLVMQVPWNSALQLLDEQAAAKLETLQPASLL
ncbi:MAG: recombination-associated protein RdgC [Candidatus Electronema sp. V4]|uniref:recombination-associated protein RdgC n=1 Tax=Candidatus Electronema sp. V4 TaxID=3454756 RepID=UPI00405560EE